MKPKMSALSVLASVLMTISANAATYVMHGTIVEAQVGSGFSLGQTATGQLTLVDSAIQKGQFGSNQHGVPDVLGFLLTVGPTAFSTPDIFYWSGFLSQTALGNMAFKAVNQAGYSFSGGASDSGPGFQYVGAVVNGPGTGAFAFLNWYPVGWVLESPQVPTPESSSLGLLIVGLSVTALAKLVQRSGSGASLDGDRDRQPGLGL